MLVPLIEHDQTYYRLIETTKLLEIYYCILPYRLKIRRFKSDENFSKVTKIFTDEN